MHRRNRSRQQLERRYAAARERLLNGQRESLLELSAAIWGRQIRAEQPLRTLMAMERFTNEAMAASFAFQHVADSGEDTIVTDHRAPRRTRRVGAGRRAGQPRAMAAGRDDGRSSACRSSHQPGAKCAARQEAGEQPAKGVILPSSMLEIEH